ncbi:MAG: PD-(D/E)XK nuclease family protein [Candidatus Pacebacteria bacterium]|nr:PD-(D/E)XK nuclease family protein [Candidatus Paceibacterota bacterium]MCF7857057.1 PD-(D/E)XK nuclease family protein [Candidatus Paceibacterota bacterium]
MSTFVKKYNPNRNADWNYGGTKWRLSRSKIDLFLECPRCFYIDNKLGTARPRGPAFTLNVAVDALFKKEFDIYRKNKAPHPLMQKYKIDAIPFEHKALNTWRENFEGIDFKHEPTGFTVSGAIDDVWITPEKKLIVVDYKATAKEGTIVTLADSAWEDQYKRQIGVYQWLFLQNGFEVDSVGYFVYANGSSEPNEFNNVLTFETTLVPCEGDHTWIEPTLQEIKECLENSTYPASGNGCEFCSYREACGKKLQDIYKNEKK